MNTTNYKQYDTRWAKLPYKDNPDNIGNNGCGEVAVCNSIIEMVSQMNQTPKTMQPYCRQFACHDGTYWSGIPTMLKHYGCTEVMEHQTMASLWKELAKGDRVAVYMMNSRPGGSKGIHWTSGGHFVCSVAYKKENGLHKVYVKDSNSTSKDRNGWISYEENMRGDVSACWSGKLNGSPAPTPTPTPPSGDKYPGPYPVVKKYLEPGDRGENVTRLQNYLNWYTDGEFFKKCGKADGVYGKNTLKYVKKMQTDFFGKSEADGLVGNKTIDKMKAYTKPKKPTPTPTPPTPTPTTKIKMIDVSDFQSNINWSKVKADGVKAVIIRCGGRGGEKGNIYEDTDFFANIKGAYKAGLAVGIYFLTQAINAKEGASEAQYTIKRWTESGIPISFPICIDSEDVTWKNPDGTTGYGRAHSKNLSKAKRTEAIKGFADECKRQGYKSMVYASTSYLEDHIDMSVLAPLMDVWVAQYYKTCQYKGKYIIWQYTSEGSVSGIKGNVDMDWCYVEPNKVDPPKPEPKPEPTPSKGHYTGKYPTVRIVKTNAQVIEDTITFARWIANYNLFHYGWGKEAHHNGCFFCGTQPTSKKNAGIKDWKTTYCCNPYIHACFAHGGCVTSMLSLCRKGGSFGFKRGEGYDTSALFDSLGKPSMGKLKPGDVMCSNDHVAILLDKGQFAEATGIDNNVPYSKKWNDSIAVKPFDKDEYDYYSRVYRFNGHVDSEYPIRYGEVSDRVADLQRYLVWYGALPQGETADGIYGEKTYKAVVKMQTDFFGAKEADGTVGNKTIAKMKEVRK